ncbi:MAG: hypothetical protein ACXAC2_12380, partial [Candidatus Kariarchaeaceae archaeon]
GDESITPTIDSSNNSWVGSIVGLPFAQNNIMASKNGVNPVDGHIDEFRYWNTERTLTEIQSDYQTVLTGAESGLQHYYQFENSLVDLAGSSDLTQSSSNWAYSSDTSSAITNGYQMDQEVQFTNLHTFMEIEELAIRVGSVSGENVGLSYWNSGWVSLASDLVGWSWNNFTLPISSSTLTLRFKTGYSASDSARGTYQVLSLFFTFQGEGFYDDYIDQESDVDSTVDKGFENSLTDMQSKDGFMANLVESSGGSTYSNKESFESSIPYSIAGSWARESDQAWHGTWSADNDGDDGGTGSMTAGTIDASNALAIHIEFYWYDNLLDNNDLWLSLYNGSSWISIIDLNTIDGTNGWHQYSTTITDSQYFVSNLLVRWTAVTIGAGKTAAIDYVTINIEESVTSDKELEQEVQFTNVLIGVPKTTLSIFTGTMGSEDLKVEYRDGSTWTQLFSDLSPNSWNNLTLTDILTTSSFTIRFVDGSKVSDSTSDSWEIDAVILNYDSQTIHYEIDWEHQTQGIDITKEIYQITIYGYSSDASEEFQVQVWNQSSSTWHTAFVEKIDNTPQWHNYTIPLGGTIGASITWRYTGTLDGNNNLYDLNQNTLYIDYAGVASWEEVPLITSPGDINNYSEGSNGNTIQWTGTDSNPDSYTVYLDETVDNSGSWSSGVPINYDIDSLLKGNHNYTIILTDISGNTVSDEVWVTVLDTTNPNIVSRTPVGNVTYEVGNTGNWINWTVNDNYENNYEIYKDELLNASGFWSSGVSIDYNVDGLLSGTYNITIILYDDSTNFITDTTYVIVNDTGFPSINQPSDPAPYEAGASGNTLSWTANDLLPNNYTIYRNGSQVDTGSWSSGVAINYNVDPPLGKGIYNFTIIVFDLSGNSISDTVIVTVLDTTDPILTYTPSDFQFAEGSTGNKVDWIATDVHPGTYSITRNGTEVQTGAWADGDNITLNLDDVGKDSYEYIIWIYDTTGNSFSDTVIITVTDETNPTVSDAADISDYVEGNTGYTITWNSIDTYPDTLTLYRNGTILFTAGWTNDSDTIIGIDGLSKGVYNYTIFTLDKSGNFATDTVIVTVNDET